MLKEGNDITLKIGCIDGVLDRRSVDFICFGIVNCNGGFTILTLIDTLGGTPCCYFKGIKL